MGQTEAVRFEKLLYFYCALNDLRNKQVKKSGECSDLDQTVLEGVTQILAAKI